MNAWALIGALALGGLAYGGVQAWLRAQHDPLGEFLSEHRAGSVQEAIGARAAAWLPGGASRLEEHLVWAQRGGRYRGQSVGTVVFTALLYALGGLGLYLLLRTPLTLTAVGIGFAWPLVDVRSKANAVRKRTTRAAPELASLLAAEMAAGSAPEAALRRAAALPGPLASLLGEAAALSQRTGRPLLSTRGVTGTLVEVFGQSGVPALQTLALQLDLIAQKGVEGADRMSDLARMLAFQYRQRLMEETEKLENRLTAAVAAFYFIPMVLLLLGAFFGAATSVF